VTPDRLAQFKYMEFVHQDARLADDFHYDWNPRLIHIEKLGQYRKKYGDVNVYRSCTLWSDKRRRESISGPIVLDIDSEEELLNDALEVTRRIIDIIRDELGIPENDYRVFFSGHKGFNLEIAPSLYRIEDHRKFVQVHCDIRRMIIKRLQENSTLKDNYVGPGKTLIDPFHEHTRLHWSINQWVVGNAKINRRKIELTRERLFTLPIAQIIARSSMQS